MAISVPLVSIGLPLYNAERYLSQALDCLLSQDYPGVELIISDNASTDATEAICRDYAARHRNVHYYRQPRNCGAIWNFEFVRNEAKGVYFMWAAFDDLRDSRYVSACVRALQAEPQAVLCCTDVQIIDEQGLDVAEEEFPSGIRPLGTLSERIRAIGRSPFWLDFYGLHVTQVLRDVPPLRRSWGFDVIHMMNVCLRGRVAHVPEPLFFYRMFRKKSTATLASTLSGSAPNSGGQRPSPTSRPIPASFAQLGAELVRSIVRAPIPLLVKPGLAAEFVWNFCVRNRTARGQFVLELARSLPAAVGRNTFPILLWSILGNVLAFPATVMIHAGRSVRRLAPRGR